MMFDYLGQNIMLTAFFQGKVAQIAAMAIVTIALLFLGKLLCD